MNITRWIRNQRERFVALVATLVGLAALLLGWIGVSGAKLPAAQIPYLASGGLLGMFSLGIAATLWLSADLQDEWRELHDLGRNLQALSDRLQVVSDDDTVANDRQPASTNGSPVRRRSPGRLSAKATNKES